MNNDGFDKLIKKMNKTKIILKPVEIPVIILPRIDFEKARNIGKIIFEIFKFSILLKIIHKVFILILLIYFICVYVVVKFDFNKEKEINGANISFINIYIIAHKDFRNKLKNAYYKILCDNKTQLKRKYHLQIIETYKNNELFKKKKGYCEGSKIYYIWKKYLKKELFSKYVGFIHYQRVFDFKNHIPDLDKIFTQYDVILNTKFKSDINMKTQYAIYHFQKFLDEIEEIIKNNFTEYYPSTKKSLHSNMLSCCNIFIMKAKDFIKYGKFVFGVLLEFDRRHNLKNDDDIKNFIKSEIQKSGKVTDEDYQYRQEGFLMERISSIFYDHEFKKQFQIGITKQ